jgi:hypothetical protein
LSGHVLEPNNEGLFIIRFLSPLYNPDAISAPTEPPPQQQQRQNALVSILYFFFVAGEG